jgi:PD-(D/E)XK nuclease superfamily
MVDIDKTAAKRSKAHTRYYSKDGTLLPGVTTILGVLNKPALVPWANNLGLAGISVREYVDALAAIGSLAHEMILAHHKNVKFEADGHPADLIDKAENCLLSYFEWERGHNIEPILCEAQLVSLLGFGGTLDLYAKVDGVRTVVDYKSGKAIYPEHVYQTAAYRHLLLENGYEVDGVRILQIGRSEDEGFSEKFVGDTSREWEIFKHCLELYKLKVGK